MRPLNDSLLRELSEHDAPLCLSLFLEMAAGGGDHDHIRISLKNAKSDGAEAIRAANADQKAASAVLERLDALDYDDVAGGHDRRIAIFIAPDLTEIVDTRFVETGVHAGDRFRLAPLLTDLERTPDHAILVASQDKTRLFRVSDGTLTPQDVPGMPESLRDIAKFSDEQEQGNTHGRESSGIPGTYKGPQATDSGKSGLQGVPHHMMAGHGWREEKETDLRDFADTLINAVQRHLSGSNVPLVVAADERLYGMIRENCEYPFLADEGITLHPREMDDSEIQHEAAACLHREVERKRSEAWDKVAMSLGRDDHEASKDPADIVTASAAGRVAHLFVRAGATLRGDIDEQTLAATIAEDGPEDLVDRAITDTLRNGGEVYPLGDLGAADTLMAAAYRYPT